MGKGVILMTTAWVRLEEYIPTVLKGWKRLKKKHFGDSIPDLKGDGYTGGAKHYKRFSIHTISDEENQKYKADVVLFTKEKRKHYVPKNIRVTINLDQFAYLLYCKKIAEKVDKKVQDVNNNNGKLTMDLKYLRSVVKTLLQKINKIIKKQEVK